MTQGLSIRTARRKAVWGPKRVGIAAALAVFAMVASPAFAGGQSSGAASVLPGQPNSNVRGYRLDGELTRRANLRNVSITPVIVEWQPGASVPAALKRYVRSNLSVLHGSVLDVPSSLLRTLAASPAVLRVHFDRPAFKHDFRTNVTVGARAVQQALGYTGAGVGVAVIDSGIASWHDDLTNRSSTQYPYGNQRVSAFVDFVNGQTTPYDDDGHGTHVAGIIAGNGYDSNGRNAGIAPDASLVVLKALDAQGNGTISTVIQALDWVLANHARYNIRVVNLSVGAAIRESYWTDPLTVAAKRLVDVGVVVVAAAGNLGNNDLGQPQYGGIGAPANAPWVLTVGASSTNGTTTRDDDTMASFSSRGPTYLDWAAKPDLVAPGVGTISLTSADSTLYDTRPSALLPGTAPTLAEPYLSLSGTSMAAPVVTGTIAVMLQANPSLTPNGVKAVLQYTAQTYSGYDALTQGAGFLNAIGAVRLARFYATAQPGQVVPTQAMWSRHLLWGNQELTGGIPDPTANAYALGTTWGTAFAGSGDNIVWGTLGQGDNIVWGTGLSAGNIVWGTARSVDNIVWGTGSARNIVWGTACGGADCDNIVWGTGRVADNIVWGTARNIVWGTAGLNVDNILWGTMSRTDNIVWGTLLDAANIVWGTAIADDNIVWGTSTDTNTVWGLRSGLDNIVWGTGTNSQVLWDSATNSPVDWTTLAGLFPRLSDEQIFYALSVLTAGPAPSLQPTITPVLQPVAPTNPAPAPPAPVLAPVTPPSAPITPAPTPTIPTGPTAPTTPNTVPSMGVPLLPTPGSF